MKLNINNIIANDIVDLGIKETTNFNDIVFLEDYADKFDDSSKEYIFNNKIDIVECIKVNEKVADIYYDEKEDSINMVFYLDYVFDRVEKQIYKNAELQEIDLEVDEVRDIASDILDDDEFNDEITRRISSINGEYEL